MTIHYPYLIILSCCAAAAAANAEDDSAMMQARLSNDGVEKTADGLFKVPLGGTGLFLETKLDIDAKQKIITTSPHCQGEHFVKCCVSGDVMMDGRQSATAIGMAVTETTAQRLQLHVKDNSCSAECNCHYAIGDITVYLDPETPVLGADSSSGSSASPWHLDRIDQREDKLKGEAYTPSHSEPGKNVQIVIVDSGVNVDHEDFEGRAIAFWEVGQSQDGTGLPCVGSPCAVDNDGHGTHTASAAAGKTYGVAPFASILNVKVMDGASGNLLDVLAGIDYAIGTTNRKRRIISASIGAPMNNNARDAWNDVIVRAVAAGIPYVAGSGNSNIDACDYLPAAIPAVIAVGATNNQDKRWVGDQTGSNWGSCVDIMAPGEMIQAAAHSSDTLTTYKTGTSMAVPQVAGAIAIHFSKSTTKDSQGDQIWLDLDVAATKDALDAATLGTDTPNKLLFVGADPTPAPTTAAPTTTSGDDERRRRRRRKNNNKGKKAPPPMPAPMLCFPGEASLQVHGHGRVPMARIRTGDNVLVQGADGRLAYENILGFMHTFAGTGKPSAFLKVKHSLGEFRASANHIVLVTDGATKMDKPVSEVRVGDQLLAVDEKDLAVPSTVLAVDDALTTLGMFAPLTASGTLVVDGVVASNYAEYTSFRKISHSFAHTLLFPIRAYHQFGFGSLFAPLWTQVCSGVADGSGSWFCQEKNAGPKRDGVESIHPFLAAGRLLGLESLYERAWTASSA